MPDGFLADGRERAGHRTCVRRSCGGLLAKNARQGQRQIGRLKILCASATMARKLMSATPVRFTKLSVLMAAYNEEATLRRCVNRILAAPLPDGISREIVLVNDGSRDATWKV